MCLSTFSSQLLPEAVLPKRLIKNVILYDVVPKKIVSDV